MTGTARGKEEEEEEGVGDTVSPPFSGVRGRAPKANAFGQQSFGN